MKTQFFSFFAVIAAVVSCGPKPVPELYHVRFPQSPELRAELLGECHWRLEYRDTKGNFRQKEVSPAGFSGTEIGLLKEWPNAVLAWPYWPEKNLAPGHFYPAGAIFPLDAAGETITLSWEAGAQAFFFRELENAQELNDGTNRLPMYFDWMRFRTLLREHDNAQLRDDPWLADWKDIAERTVRSGFRQSYVRKETRTGTEIIVPHSGPWLSASPFRPPLFWEIGEEVTLPLSARPEVYVCPGGKLSISSQMQLWIPFPLEKQHN